MQSSSIPRSEFTAKPQTPAPILETIPAEMATRHQWLAWKWEFVKDRWTKVPFSPNGGQRKLGGKASVTDPTTWASLADAVGYYKHARMDGIGYAFADDDPYVGVDQDHCRDSQTGELQEWAARNVSRLDSYTEASVSRTGAHTIVRGALPPFGRKKGDFEVYQEKRFFTWSGNHLEGTPTTIEDRNDVLQVIHREVFGDRVTERVTMQNTSVDVEDAELLERAFEAKNGEVFRALWGKEDDENANPSVEDARFAERLLWWVGGDVERADQLGRQSKRVRDKWDSPRGGMTWWRYTLDNIRSVMTGFYAPPGVKLCGVEHDEEVDEDPPALECGCTQCGQLAVMVERQRKTIVQQRTRIDEMEALQSAQWRVIGNKQLKSTGIVGAAVVNRCAEKLSHGQDMDPWVPIVISGPGGLSGAAGMSPHAAGRHLQRLDALGVLERRVTRGQDGHDHVAVRLPDSPVTVMETLATLDPAAVVPTLTDKRFGKRIPRCPSHPTASVIRRETTEYLCSQCGEYLAEPEVNDVEMKHYLIERLNERIPAEQYVHRPPDQLDGGGHDPEVDFTTIEPETRWDEPNVQDEHWPVRRNDQGPWLPSTDERSVHRPPHEEPDVQDGHRPFWRYPPPEPPDPPWGFPPLDDDLTVFATPRWPSGTATPKDGWFRLPSGHLARLAPAQPPNGGDHHAT